MSEYYEIYEMIYLLWSTRNDPDGMFWCQDQINDDDIPYIREDIYTALKAENERLQLKLNQLHEAYTADIGVLNVKLNQLHEAYTADLASITNPEPFYNVEHPDSREES